MSFAGAKDVSSHALSPSQKTEHLGVPHLMIVADPAHVLEPRQLTSQGEVDGQVIFRPLHVSEPVQVKRQGIP